MIRKVQAASLVAVAAFSAGCQTKVSEKPIGAPITVRVPLGLPEVPVPADNPVTLETVALGRKLFYEKKLSADNTLSCSVPQPATGVHRRPEAFDWAWAGRPARATRPR
jgi:cytochrome c peroxidase